MGADYVLEKLPDVSGPDLVEAGRYSLPPLLVLHQLEADQVLVRG